MPENAASSTFVVKTSRGFLSRMTEPTTRLQLGERNYAVGFGSRLSDAIYFGKKENALAVAKLAARNPDVEAPLVLSFEEAIQSLVEYYRNMKK